LSKQEKRALKFAIAKGATLDEIDDLKGFLKSQIEQSKHVATRGATGKGTRQVKQGVMKVGDYQQLESNYDL
jgi:hypothetical protein